MTTRNQMARIAGFLYLVLIICGIFSLMYVPSKIIDWKNASQTLQNIKDFEVLFRMGVVAGIFTYLSFTFLSFALYKLFKEVSKTHAMLLVAFVLLSIPVSFINILQHFSILTLISSPGYLQGMDSVELQNQVMLHLANHDNGILISYFFWGLWLFPFGYLVYKSNFLPKFLGIFLMLGCFSYLINFFGEFFFSSYNKTLFSTIVSLPSSIGEFGICLWLLIMATNKLNFRKKEASKVIVSL